jgi:hypothetical protein
MMRRSLITAKTGHAAGLIPSAGLILLIVLFTMGGCGRGEREDSAETSPGTPDVDRLRALPYVGGTPVEAGDSSGVILYDEKRTCPGVRLYTMPMLARAELIDERGLVLRHWQGPDGDSWQRAELLDDGRLLVIGAEGQGWTVGGSNGRAGDADRAAAHRPSGPIPDSTRYVMCRDARDRLLWKRRLPAHHDIERLDDGRLLAITSRDREIPLDGRISLVRDDQLTLLDANGEVLETRSILDAVLRTPDRFPLQPVPPPDSKRTSRIDLFHANSIERMHLASLFARDPLYGPDHILVCFRHQDRIAIIDWNRDAVVWAWGQGRISGPHDAQVLENGHILLFDNGLAAGRSRAVEIDPLTGEVAWEYRGRPSEPFFTIGRGSAQRLPNGNTLLAESDRGRAVEVTADGEIVWEFLCPHRSREGERAALARIVWHDRDRVKPPLDE